ncbi:unnamed protein product [Camellia sinensis]
MGGADMLIYLLRPKPTPSDLSTHGAVIPSVNTNFAEHHLTQLPAHSTGSSAAELQHLGCKRPCCASCPSSPITELLSSYARLHSGEAKLEIGHTGQPKAFLPSYGCALSNRTTHKPWNPYLTGLRADKVKYLGSTRPCHYRAKIAFGWTQDTTAQMCSAHSMSG